MSHDLQRRVHVASIWTGRNSVSEHELHTDYRKRESLDVETSAGPLCPAMSMSWLP